MMAQRVFGDADLPETFIDSLGTLARLKCLRIPNLPMPSPVIQPPSPFPSLSSLQVTKMTCKYGRGFAFCQTTLTDLTLSFLPGVQVRSELMEGFTNLRCLRISGGDFVDEPKTKRRILLSVSSLKLSGCSNLGWLWRAFGERLDKVVLHSMATDGIVKFLSALDVGFGDLRLSLLNEPLLCDSIVYAIMSRSPTSSGKPVLAV